MRKVSRFGRLGAAIGTLTFVSGLSGGLRYYGM